MVFKRFFFLPLLLVFPSFASYEQQGFLQFQEHTPSMDFVCTGQCFALLGAFSGFDYVSLKGTLEGTGSVGYGVLVGEEILPRGMIPIRGKVTLDKTHPISSYEKTSDASQIMLIVSGMIVGSNVYLLPHTFGSTSWYQKIGQGWQNFWKMENLSLHSINYRYGVFLLGKSIVQYGYLLFLVCIVCILLFSKKNKKNIYRKIFFGGMGIFLFIGIRNFISYIWIVDQGITFYTKPSMTDKSYFDLGDYIALTDQVRKSLHLDTRKTSCNIYLSNFPDGLFIPHRKALYIQPCIIVYTPSEADYLLYYKQNIPAWNLDKSILMEFHGSYLLQNNKNSSSPDIEILSGLISTSFTQ